MDDFRKVNVFKIGEICNKIHSGGTPSTRNKEEYYGGNIPWLRSGEINFNSITNTEMFITELAIKNSSAKWIRNKSVLIALTGATVARTCVNEITLTANQSCCALETNESIINYKYLYYYLASKYFEIKGMAQGALTSLNLDLIKKITVPVPKIKVQEEIVKILDSFTNLIDALNEELSLRQKQFEYYREKLLTFDDNIYVNISNICKKIVSGGTPKTTIKRYYEGNIPWLRTEEVDYCDIYETKKYITEEAVANSSAKIIPVNCVIIAMYGATAAKCCINKIPLCTNQACCNLEIDENCALYKFVYHNICKEYVKLKSLGEGSQNNISGQKIKDYKIPIPSLKVQQSIVSKLDAFESLISSLKEEIALRQKQYEYYREKLLTFE